MHLHMPCRLGFRNTWRLLTDVFSFLLSAQSVRRFRAQFAGHDSPDTRPAGAFRWYALFFVFCAQLLLRM